MNNTPAALKSFILTDYQNAVSRKVDSYVDSFFYVIRAVFSFDKIHSDHIKIGLFLKSLREAYLTAHPEPK